MVVFGIFAVADGLTVCLRLVPKRDYFRHNPHYDTSGFGVIQASDLPHLERAGQVSSFTVR